MTAALEVGELVTCPKCRAVFRGRGIKAKCRNCGEVVLLSAPGEPLEAERASRAGDDRRTG